MLLYLATCNKAWRRRPYVEVLTSGGKSRNYCTQECNDPVQGRPLCAWAIKQDWSYLAQPVLLRHQKGVDLLQLKLSSTGRQTDLAMIYGT